MSNHVHILVRSGNADLSNTIRDFKKFTSKQIIQQIKNGTESRKDWLLKLFERAAQRQNKEGSYQVWTHENHAIEIYSNKFIDSKIEYIHNNPVRAGIVEKPEEYIYSSAKNYAGENGIINIEPLISVWKTFR